MIVVLVWKYVSLADIQMEGKDVTHVGIEYLDQMSMSLDGTLWCEVTTGTGAAVSCDHAFKILVGQVLDSRSTTKIHKVRAASLLGRILGSVMMLASLRKKQAKRLRKRAAGCAETARTHKRRSPTSLIQIALRS